MLTDTKVKKKVIVVMNPSYVFITTVQLSIMAAVSAVHPYLYCSLYFGFTAFGTQIHY